MENYEIKREQDLRLIVANLDAQKIKLYDMAADAKNVSRGKDQDECYALINEIQAAMTAVSKAALKIEKKHEQEANNRLYAQMGL